MSFIKALFPGFILTFIVAGLIGSTGSQGGFLDIGHFDYEGWRMYWSWALFVIGTGLSWFLLAMME